MNLTNDQQQIYNLVEQTNDNFFIGGKPGTGKSVLTRYLFSKGRKPYTITAPTGLAALNALGKTLHSAFNIPIINDSIIPTDYTPLPKNPNVMNYIKFSIRNLIIDEVSMVRADVLDFIDRLLRAVKQNDRPFGGIQVIFIGDFYQLPPVAPPAIIKQLKEAGYESQFAFDSFVWQQANVQYCELTEVLRQKGDLPFMKLLNNAREGVDMEGSDITKLNKQVGKTDGLRIRLVSTNREADDINSAELRKLKEEPVTFTAEYFGEWKEFPVDTELVLKVGAQVMVKKNRADSKSNDPEASTVNGTLGIVTEIFDGVTSKELPEDEDPYVKIKLESGNEVKIYRKWWEKKIKEWDSVAEQWKMRTVASFEQMPLALAWCISMHKSQGQTFDKVHISPAKVFAPGQLYVAISRSRTLKGISLETPVLPRMFFAHRRVIRYFETLKSIV